MHGHNRNIFHLGLRLFCISFEGIATTITSITPFGATDEASEIVGLARAKLRRGITNYLAHGTLLTGPYQYTNPYPYQYTRLVQPFSRSLLTLG